MSIKDISFAQRTSSASGPFNEIVITGSSFPGYSLGFDPSGDLTPILLENADNPAFTTSVRLPDGLVTAPGLRFADELTTGIYRTSASPGIMRFAILGVNVATLQAEGRLTLVRPTARIAFGTSGDVAFGRNGAAGSALLGGDPAAAPDAYILQISTSSRSGTDSNVAGASATIRPGNGTGNATGSALIFETPTATSSGSGAQTYTERLRLSAAGAVFAVPISGDGSGLTTLNGSSISSGTVANARLTAAARIHSVGFTATGADVTTGKVKGFFRCPYAGTIVGWSIVVDAGTGTVKVWKIASGTAKPTVSNVINTSGVAISTGTAVISTTVTDFTSTAVAANDIFAFEITAAATAAEFTFQLDIQI